jgi:hypothetical protein
MMLRSRFLKAKYAASMASWRTEQSTLSIAARKNAASPSNLASLNGGRRHLTTVSITSTMMSCVVELNTSEKVGVARDIGDHETGGFWFRKHRPSPCIY